MSDAVSSGQSSATGSWAGRRVTVVADFDSFLRAAATHALGLERLGASIRYDLVFARLGQVSDAQLADIGLASSVVRTRSMADVTSRAYLEQEDVVVLALSGLRTRRFLARFHRAFVGAKRRPVVVTLYPGLIFRFHLEGMTSRMGADLLLLNSPLDLRLYETALGAMGLVNRNAMCAGLALLPPRMPPREARAPRTVLFTGQPTVPEGREERRYVVASLIRKAREFPDAQWLLKPRHRRGETTLHRATFHYEDLLEDIARSERIPDNFSVVHGPIGELFGITDLCLTVSSTAALEALQMGVPTRVLTDLGVHEHLGNHFFAESGLCAELDEVRPDAGWREPDPSWWSDRVSSAADHAPRVHERLASLLEAQRESDAALPPPYPRRFGHSASFERYLEEREGWEALAEPNAVPKRMLNRVVRLRAHVRGALEGGRTFVRALLVGGRGVR